MKIWFLLLAAWFSVTGHLAENWFPDADDAEENVDKRRTKHGNTTKLTSTAMKNCSNKETGLLKSKKFSADLKIEKRRTFLNTTKPPCFDRPVELNRLHVAPKKQIPTNLQSVSSALANRVNNLINTSSEEYAMDTHTAAYSLSSEIDNALNLAKEFYTSNQTHEYKNSASLQHVLQKILEISMRSWNPLSSETILEAVKIWNTLAYLSQEIPADKLSQYLSENSTQNFIILFTKNVNTEIQTIFFEILEEIVLRLETKEELTPVVDIEDNQSEWQLFQAMMSQTFDIKSYWSSDQSPSHLESILKFTKQIDYQIRSYSIKKLEKSLKQLFFIREISLFRNELPNTLPWNSQVLQIFKTTQNKLNWQNFLLELSRKLITYELQGRRNNFTHLIANLITLPITIGQLVSKGFEFLTTLTCYDSIKNVNLTFLMFSQLKQLITNALGFHVARKGNETIVHGYFILASEVQNVSKELFEGGILTLSASHTIFIDADLELSPGANLAILAPHWEIIVPNNSIRLITLTGKPGEAFSDHAADAKFPFRKGSNGSPGRPGGVGGSFYGIIYTNTALSSLKIFLSGGKGGDGQPGGKGGWGRNGSNAYYNGNYSQWIHSRYLYDDYMLSLVNYKYSFNYSTKGKGDCETCRDWKTNVKFLGDKGIIPGPGGDGGIGGKGGPPGDFILFGTKDTNLLDIFESSQGPDGSDGKGGPSGNCTRDGQYYETILEKEQTWGTAIATLGIKTPYKFRIQKPRKWLNSVCVSSPPGITGGNTGGEIFAPNKIKLPVDFNNSKKLYTIQLLRDHTQSRLLYKSQIIKALENLWNDPIYLESETLSGLFSEFFDIEDEFSSNYIQENTSSSLKFYYQSLLTRIFQQGNRNESTEQERIALSWLYTTTLSKLTNFINSPVLIVDLLGYFQILKSKAAEIVELNNFNMIYEQNLKFNQQTEEMIAEGNRFVANEILPSIQTLQDKLTSLIIKFGSEAAASASKTQENTAELKGQKYEYLVKQGPLRIFFSLLKVVGSVTSIFGPIGQAVGTVVSTGSSLGEIFLKPQRSQPPASFENFDKIYASIENSMSQFELSSQEYYSNKVQDLNAQIGALQQVANQFPEEFKDTTDRLERNKRELDELSDKKGDLAKLESISENIEQIIKEKENLFQSQMIASAQSLIISKQESINSAQSTSRTILEVLQRTKQIGTVGREVVGMVGTLVSVSGEVNAIDDEIQQQENRLKQLKALELNLYKKVIPAIQQMGDNLRTAGENLKTQSPVAVQVGKWKVQELIRDMRLNLKKVSKDFELQEDLLNIVDTLGDTMGLLVAVFDRIQGYEEKKSLADHLALLTMTTLHGNQEIQFSDQDFQKLFNRVQLSLKSNLLLSLYSDGLSAFNQFIFPFAATVAAEISPTKFISTHSKFEMVTATIQKINLIEAKLNLYKSTVQNFDQNILKGEFNSSVYSSVPFYVWPGIKYRKAITALLSGEPVSLMAHPERGAMGRVCVKFTKIKLCLRWTGSGDDPGIMKELEYFQIRMTHHGRSYYKAAQNEVYVVEGNKVDFVYTNTSSSLSQLKVSFGDSILSPYGMWTFHVTNIPGKFRSFKNLKSYTANVDLLLEGMGTYLNEDSLDFTLLRLDEYYKKSEADTLGMDPLQAKIEVKL